MRRFIYLIIWLLLPAWLSAQTNISKVEYWYDGNYSTVHTQSPTPGTSVSYTDLLDVSSLEPGLHTASFRFQDDRGVWGSLLTKFFSYNPESFSGPLLISAVEYWYDGKYTSAVETSLTPGASIDWNTLLDVSSLNNGLHTTTCRFKDSRGTWSAPFIRFFSIDENDGLQQIVGLEYWLDDDYTNKFDSTFAATSIMHLDKIVDVSSLWPGLHFLNIRLMNESGKWSAPACWYFVKDESETPEFHKLSALEYWYDGDYSSVQTNSISATSLINLDEQLNVSALTNGVHSVSYRFQNETGDWSPAYSQLFSKFPDAAGPEILKITMQEYWFNGDYSNVQTSTVPSTNALNIDENIDVSSLTNGIHILSSRYKDEAGNWSSAYSSLFVKYSPDPLPDMHDLVAMEYWIDGAISGKVNTSITPGAEFMLDTQLDISALTDGLHSISFRFQDKAGNWSSALSALFSKFENETITADNKITGYRYWADNLIGSATEVILATPVKSLNLDEILDVSSFPSGQHVASFQFRDDQGIWSTAISQTYSKVVEPTLTISASDSSVCKGSVINFAADYTDADVIEWNFGDGSNSNEFSPEHIYTEAGVFEVSAIVTHTDSSKSAYDTIVGGIEVSPNYDIWLGTNDTLQICESSLPFVLGSQNITNEGFYTETFTTIQGCDSVVSFNLVINPSDSIWLADTICEGDLPYTFGEQSLIADGIYTEDFPTAFGCDSVVTLTLVVNDTTINTDAVTICETDLPYTFGTSSLTSAGIYTEVFSNVYGCDSTVTLTLTVNDTSLTELEMSVCENDLPLIIGLDTFYNEGVYTKQLNNTMGCDSTVILSLNVLDTSLVTAEIEICENLLPFTFGTQSLSAGGVYSESFEKDNGCDSTVILTLIVKDTFAVLDTVTVCESELPFNWDGDELWTSGPYIRTFTAENGCDSTVSLTFNVLDSSLVEQKITVCESELPFTFGTQTLDTSGIFTEVFDAANGCDSTVILTLNVLDSTIRNQEVTVCAGDVPYVFGTQTLSSSGIFTEVFNGSNGCDSTVILNLTVSDTFRIADTVTICENDIPYTFGTQTLLTDGIYTELFTTTAGCDSTVVLVFAINDTAQSAFADTICENDLPYVFGSQSLTSSGVYSEAFVAANGCDSVVTLSLKVHQSYVTHIYETVSPSELPFVFGSQQLTKTGTFSNTYPTIFGCDSTITLHLQVRDINPPVAKCNPIEVELNHNGFYSLDNFDLEAIAQGSNDDISEFEDLTISVSPAEFTCENIGENAVTVKVKDAVGNQATCTTTITVLDQIANPKIDEVDNQIMDEDSNLELVLTGILGGTACETWDVALSATSLGTDLISELTIDHLPNDSSALLHILLQDNQNGIDSIFISVQDSLGNSTNIGFLLTVNAVNDRPEIVQEIEDQIMTAGDSASITVSKIPGEYYSDLDDTTFIFSLDAENEELPDWIVIRETVEQYIYTFTPSESDTGCFNFILTIEDETGGATYDTFRVCIDPLEVGVSVMEANDFGINLYPNPTRGEVNITLKSPPQGEIELLVTSISGSEVLRKTYRSGERISFNLSENISGTYLVILQMHNKRIVRKLILDKK
nr:T9SS type A sorting domain-containing protein [uncultured Draconibacterium sp.]